MDTRSNIDSPRDSLPSSVPGSRPGSRPGWLLVAGLALAVVGLTFESGWARAAASPQDDDQNDTQVLPTLSAGGTADSNGSMIAVTGVDITGQSILYLVDTETKQICAYQASGGSSSTQGIKFVGARRIDLDLSLDGFNDKTESNGKPLGYKDLRRMFEARSLAEDAAEDGR